MTKTRSSVIPTTKSRQKLRHFNKIHHSTFPGCCLHQTISVTVAGPSVGMETVAIHRPLVGPDYTIANKSFMLTQR